MLPFRAAVFALLALPLFAELRHGILDETIPGDVQVQSAGENMVMMVVDSRASGQPDGVGDFILTLRAETPFDERFAFRIQGASVVIRANRVMAFAPDRKLAVVFEHDANCPDCDYGRSKVLRYTGFEVRRLNGDARWPRLAPRRADVIEDDATKPKRVVKTERAPGISTNETNFYYEPVEYWDPCEDEFYESPFCGPGAGGLKPAKTCAAGGVGSTSCSLTGCVTSYGSSAGCSTSCSAGYYSCCYCSDSGAHCGCYKQ
ncbi:MAG TPA: hypothetical protein VEO54_23500 [Thermoanaerobaculia bacterium]|nr:hypothetical protein [Thermoanaerobaculia bacterium]